MSLVAVERIPYLYPGGRNTVMWLLVALVTTVVTVWRLAPTSWRPQGLLVPAVAVAAAYLALNAGFRSGFVQWLDHEVFERLRGGADDIATWLVACVGAAIGVALVSLVGQGGRR